MKKIGFKTAIAIILTLALLTPILGVNSVVFAGAVEEDSQIGLVPVIFDGEYYTASEFEKIGSKLKIAVVTPSKDGTVLYAFSTLEKFAHHFDPNGTLVFIGQEDTPLKQPIGIRSEDVGYGYNWEDINKGGSCLVVQEDYNRPDLSVYNPSWSNRISSCRLPYDSGKPANYFMFLSYLPNSVSSDLFAVPNGYYVPTLVPYTFYYSGSWHSWNDAACGIYWGVIKPNP